MHRVICVVQDVEKDLLQLMGVANHVRQALVEMLHNVNAVAVEIIGAQLDRAAQDRIQLERVALRRHLAGEAQQILHDLLGPLRLLQNHTQIFVRRLRQIRILHQKIGKAEDGRERIIDFMGDAGNQLANGGHLFGMHQFVAKNSRIGDIGEHDDDAGHDSLLVAHRAEVG